MTQYAQNSFNGGELSPQVSFRNDQPRRQTGAKVIRNMIPLTQGPVIRRPGLFWCVGVGDTAHKVRVLGFIFSEEQSYIVEMGEKYIRILYDGNVVVDKDGEIRLDSPYSGDELFDIDYVQSADVLYLVHKNHYPRRLERRGQDDWALVPFQVGTLQGPPEKPTASATGSGKERTYSYVVTAVNDDTGEESIPSEAVSITGPKSLDVDNFITVNIKSLPGSTLYNFYKDRSSSGVYGYIGSSAPKQTVLDTIELRKAMLMLADDCSVQESIDPVAYIRGPVTPELISTQIKTYANTLSDPVKSDLISFADQFLALQAIDPESFPSMTRDELQANITAAAPAEPVGETVSLADRGETPSSDDRPPKARNPFAGIGNYPSVVTFFQQRLGLGGSSENPDTIYLSQTANFQNFNVSEPVKDDDAVTFTFASGQVNRIVWMYGAKTLQVGTIGGEWTVKGTEEKPITPVSIDANNVSSKGGARLRPLYVDGRTLFVQADRRTVRELAYDFASDSYIPADQTVFAEHITSGRRIVDWAYQNSPYNVAWVVFDDGSMAGYSYNVEQQVRGWHRHDTDGKIESVAVVPHVTADDVYFVVNRNGKRSIERMRPYSVDQDITESFFVDSGATVDAGEGNTYTEVTGLDHLVGKEVSILADGYVLPLTTVSDDGKVELPYPARVVTIGLQYSSELVPLTPENAPGGAVTLLNKRTINSVHAYYYRTVGGKYGIYGQDKTYELITKKGFELAQPQKLESDTKELPFPNNMGPLETVVLSQDDPLPLNIFAIVTNMEVGTT